MSLHSQFATFMEPLGPFEDRPEIAVAVSGGGDSMALLLLAQDWAKARKGKLIALTVDHGLRQGSAKDARQVARWCKALGIVCETLRWNGAKPATGKAEKAREVRYCLLAETCRARGTLHLLVAHNLEDQAETLLMRLSRGSGLAGLAAMQPLTMHHGIRILRPLLGVSGKALRAYLQKRRQPWLEDPSNQTDGFARNRLRHALAALDDARDLASSIAASAALLRQTQDWAEHEQARALAGCVAIFPEGYAFMDPSGLAGLPQTLALPVLSRLVQAIGGLEQAPRAEKLLRFYDFLKKGEKKRMSLGGCLCIPMLSKKHQGKWLLCREPAALEALMPIRPGERRWWDKRFEVAFEEGTKGKRYHIGALGEAGAREVRRIMKIPPALPSQILPLLPTLWELESPAAIPHIGWKKKGILLQVKYHPPLGLS